MTREDISRDILKIDNNRILLELATSVGKSKIALDWLSSKKPSKILIVIPRLVLIDTWKNEMRKWGYADIIKCTHFSTYVSLHKQMGLWDAVIFDETQHLSDRCKASLDGIISKYMIFLSATVTKEIKSFLVNKYNISTYKISAREAIDNNILPDPKVILIPKTLDNENKTESFKMNNGLVVKCTPREYYIKISNNIDYWKQRYYREGYLWQKNKWLRSAKERLDWLALKKNSIVLDILKKYKSERTITFCASIEQTEKLGSYAINSKNKKGLKNLELFNNKKINHITSCNMLNEGCNLNDCKIGIFANLNSSDILIVQRLGRLLRHKEPVIVIPYFIGTREQELVDKMMENYNPELIEYEN